MMLDTVNQAFERAGSRNCNQSLRFTRSRTISMTRCPQCDKKPMMVNKRKLLRGNYNPVNRYRKYVNLQWAVVDGTRIKICTSCIKTLAK